VGRNEVVGDHQFGVLGQLPLQMALLGIVLDGSAEGHATQILLLAPAGAGGFVGIGIGTRHAGFSLLGTGSFSMPRPGDSPVTAR